MKTNLLVYFFLLDTIAFRFQIVYSKTTLNKKQIVELRDKIIPNCFFFIFHPSLSPQLNHRLLCNSQILCFVCYTCLTCFFVFCFCFWCIFCVYCFLIMKMKSFSLPNSPHLKKSKCFWEYSWKLHVLSMKRVPCGGILGCYCLPNL